MSPTPLTILSVRPSPTAKSADFCPCLILGTFNAQQIRALRLRRRDALRLTWQSALARDLGKSDREIRRWLDDPRKIPDETVKDLHSLLHRRSQAIVDLRRELLTWIPDHDDLDHNYRFLSDYRLERQRARELRRAKMGALNGGASA